MTDASLLLRQLMREQLIEPVKIRVGTYLLNMKKSMQQLCD